MEKSGFTLVQKQPRKSGDIWHPEQGGDEWHSNQGVEGIRRLYHPNNTEDGSDIPFVKMKTPSQIKY